ncbi:MAG: aminotransferase class V-fold PLP-dependent enzyme, partial [Bacteroidota bacterium]
IMAYNRRKFIHQSSRFAGLGALSSLTGLGSKPPSLQQVLSTFAPLSAEECATTEQFWQQIRLAFNVSTTTINLNNGGVSPQPRIVQEAQTDNIRYANELPTMNMNWRLKNSLPSIKQRLAQMAGCAVEELALQRNTTEALSTIIFGLPLKAGDEVVLSKQAYPNMINAWEQRAQRDGIVLKWVNWDFPMQDETAMVRHYTAAFSPKTKLAHLTHVINWNGQIIPVAAIAAVAQQNGIEVLVDAAHSFAHFPYTIPELNCDYWGTSLHKWLCAPFGTGLLYIKKTKIEKVYPLFGAQASVQTSIQKFESRGTIALAKLVAIGQALDFHDWIGAERKFARLHYLKNYWIDRVKHLDTVTIQTSTDAQFSGAIALVSIVDKTAKDLNAFLFKHYRIHANVINWENIQGLRITPHIYTLPRELDLLVEGIKRFAQA